MSTQIPARPAASPDQRESPWAGGLTVVAATFLVIAGVWHALAGFAVLKGQMWARVVGIIWALATYRREAL